MVERHRCKTVCENISFTFSATGLRGNNSCRKRRKKTMLVLRLMYSFFSLFQCVFMRANLHVNIFHGDFRDVRKSYRFDSVVAEGQHLLLLKEAWSPHLHTFPTAALSQFNSSPNTRTHIDTQIHTHPTKPHAKWWWKQCLLMFNTNTAVSWEGGYLESKQSALWCSIMGSQCHSSWRLFHLPPGPGQITYYITVHLVSKDTLTTPLTEDEKSFGVMLLAPMCAPLLHVYVFASTSVCMRQKKYSVALKPSISLYRHYYTFLSSPYWKTYLLFTLFRQQTAAVSTVFALSDDDALLWHSVLCQGLRHHYGKLKKPTGSVWQSVCDGASGDESGLPCQIRLTTLGEMAIPQTTWL